MITYTVFDDPGHEERVYSGWVSSSNTTTGPTTVYLEDWADGYTETLIMSAAPAVSANGAPTGNEAIADIQALMRGYVDPTTDSVGNNTLTSNMYYDSRGDLIEEVDPNSPVIKNVYNGAGELTITFTTDGESGTSYAAASSVADDIVLSQTQYMYDGDVIETITSDRLPNANGTGELGNLTLGVAARVSYTADYYDAGDRLIDEVDVGTNGGLAWTRPSSVPTRSNEVLVTTDIYGNNGLVQDVIDPLGIDTRTYYNGLGETTETIEDYTGNGTPTDDTNQTTFYTYGPAGMTSLTAVDPGGANQTTT